MTVLAALTVTVLAALPVTVLAALTVTVLAALTVTVLAALRTTDYDCDYLLVMRTVHLLSRQYAVPHGASS